MHEPDHVNSNGGRLESKILTQKKSEKVRLQFIYTLMFL